MADTGMAGEELWMNWDAIGAIAETVGGIGVVLTLFYLALQIRGSNRVATFLLDLFDGFSLYGAVRVIALFGL